MVNAKRITKPLGQYIPPPPPGHGLVLVDHVGDQQIGRDQPPRQSPASDIATILAKSRAENTLSMAARSRPADLPAAARPKSGDRGYTGSAGSAMTKAERSSEFCMPGPSVMPNTATGARISSTYLAQNGTEAVSML